VPVSLNLGLCRATRARRDDSVRPAAETRLIEVSLMSRPPYLLVALLSFGSFGIIASHPRAARAADPREEQLAQALFEEARGLMDRERYAEACPKLKESQRLDPGGGTLLNLAICHEKEGKLATAKGDYEQALALATRDARKDRQAIARARLAALEPTVPRLSVSVGSAADAPGLEVKLDGLVLRRAAWGVPTLVDPGAHRLEASAPGRATWSMPIAIRAAQRKSVEVPALGPRT
jgi:tetratricopeptide (TPR) repeat protein